MTRVRAQDLTNVLPASRISPHNTEQTSWYYDNVELVRNSYCDLEANCEMTKVYVGVFIGGKSPGGGGNYGSEMVGEFDGVNPDDLLQSQ